MRSYRTSIRLLLPVLLGAASLQGGDGGIAAVAGEINRSPQQTENLRRLCDEIGARMTGTPALDHAVSWAVGEFKAAGLQHVKAEPYVVPLVWQPIETRLNVLEPAEFAVRANSSAWVPATPSGGLEADVLDGGTGRPGAIRGMGEHVRGKIVLIRSGEAHSFYDLGVDQRNTTAAVEEAAEAGAAALLFESNRPDGVLYRNINVFTGGLDRLPTALVGRPDAQRLIRLLDAGKRVRVRLQIRNKVRRNVTAHNVVAEIRGSELPGEMVIAGAHLDSWDVGTGCVDNAANVSLMMEIARAIEAAGVRPRRTIRFVLFTGEEQGLLGSRAYVDRHAGELDHVAAVVVHDMGIGRIKGYSLGGRASLEEPLTDVLRTLPAGLALRHTTDAFFGSDHFDFWLQGVPALVAMQDTSGYYSPYHAETDTLDGIEMGKLREQTVIAATAVLGLANLPERFGERLSRAQMEALLRETKVDEQLEFLGLLEEWKAGSRGRARD